MQWFTGGAGGSSRDGAAIGGEKPVSLLADWNAYSSSRSDEAAGTIDLEAAVPASVAPLFRSANETILGAFNTVSKGVRELPGNVQTAASTMPSRQSFLYFGLLMASGVFFLFISFTMFLPVMVVMPQKFAVCFTLGSIFTMASFFALKGPKAQLLHMLSKERLPFTVGFVASMGAAIYASMVLHSYFLSVIFAVVQVLGLLYYVISYFPGGATGMRFLSSMITSAILKCFGR